MGGLFRPKYPYETKIAWFKKSRKQIEFILTTLSYAVGLGNTWRFPYLVYKHGGASFLFPYFLIIIVLGIPMFFLEVALGQFSGLNPVKAFVKMTPIFQGIGYASVLLSCILAYFYNLIITYSIFYFIFSMNSELPWSKCDDGDPECFVNPNLGNCSTQIDYSNLKSPAEIYFYKKVLRLTEGINDLGGMDWKLPLFMLASWIIIFLAISRSVKSIGLLSYITATLPYIMITILIVLGSSLKGSNLGIDFYVGSFDAAKLIDPDLWKDAAAQAFFSISACGGGLIILSSYNDFNNNVITDSILVPIGDMLTGFYAGFAIFTMLGYLFLAKCAQSFSQIVSQGPELAFIVYPEGLSLSGSAAPVFSAFFFLMMMALGFGTEFSGMEIPCNTIVVMFKKYIQTKKQEIFVRGLICLTYFAFGLFLVTDGGFHILDLLESATGSYPFLFVGLFQLISVAWVYGGWRFVADIEKMIGKKPKWFWYIVLAFWKFICPIIILAIIIFNFVTTKPSSWPVHAEIIFWAIALSPIYIVGGCALYQIYLNKKRNGIIIWRELFDADEEYYKKSRDWELDQKNGVAEHKSNRVAPLKDDFEKEAIELS